VLLAVLLVPGLVAAQDISQGGLTGTVKDETGARLPGATVTTTSPTHIRPETTTSNEQGQYNFRRLTPGLYSITAELSGFATVVIEAVKVDPGKEYRIDITMKVAAIAETVTVTGESPVVDPKSSTSVTNFSYDFLQSIPQPRAGTGSDIFMLAPGVDQSQSVGGSAGSGSTAWVFDGVDVSDPGSGGQFPFYNYDYIEESEVITYGAPAQYGKYDGAVFNVVTKSGGLDYHGTGNVYYTGGSLVGNNVDGLNEEFPDAELEADDIIKRWDMTFNMGGPIIPNTLHFYAGFQQIIDDTQEAGVAAVRTDRSTRLLAKLTWQVNPQNRISGFYEFDRFPVDGRVPGGFLAPDPNVAVKEPSPNTTPRVHWQYTPSENGILEVMYSGFYGFFDLEPRNELPGILDFGPYAIYQSYYGFYHFGRGRTEVKGDYTQYVDDAGGQHEIKFGLGYELGETDDNFVYGTNSSGQNVLYYAYNGYVYGGDTRLGEFVSNTQNKVLSAFVQDSWTIAERFTLNLGVRYDRSTAHWATPGIDGFTFNDWAPRAFATVDLTGDGKTVLRGGWGRFYDGLHGNMYDDFDPSLPPRAFWVFNSGLGGGCGQTVSGFPNVGGGPECFTGIEAANVDVVNISNPLDTIGINPALKNHYVDQLYVAFEREIGADISVGVAYIRKEDGNLFGGVDNQSVFAPTQVEDPMTGEMIAAFQRVSPASQERRILTNRDDILNRAYNGFELRFQRRFRDNWQFLGSWMIQKIDGTSDNVSAAPSLSLTSFQGGNLLRGSNPNHLIKFDGELVNSRRHVFKLQGSYRIPTADVLIGVLYGYQSGRTYNRYVRARVPQSLNILADQRGSFRLPAGSELDLHLEKFFGLGGSELGILLDVFNTFNDDTYTRVNERSGDEWANPTRVIEPRKLQIGVRWIF
jgi:hypothetical protein